MNGYDRLEICRLLNLPVKTFRAWQRLGLLPSGRDGFSWSDLSLARTLQRLVTQEGLKARQLVPFLDQLRCQRVWAEGQRLLVRDGPTLREAFSGQGVFDWEQPGPPRVVDWPAARTSALRPSPESPPPSELTHWEDLHDLGCLLLTTEDFESAARVLSQAVQAPEAGAGTWFQLAQAWLALERLQDAAEALQTALRRDPLFAEARFRLARLYEQQGAAGKAYRQWREFLKRHPGHPDAPSLRLYLAQAYAGVRLVPLRGRSG